MHFVTDRKSIFEKYDSNRNATKTKHYDHKSVIIIVVISTQLMQWHDFTGLLPVSQLLYKISSEHYSNYSQHSIYLIKIIIAAIMRFLLHSSIMTARSPPDLLNVATVLMTEHVQNTSRWNNKNTTTRLHSHVQNQFSGRMKRNAKKFCSRWNNAAVMKSQNTWDTGPLQ